MQLETTSLLIGSSVEREAWSNDHRQRHGQLTSPSPLLHHHHLIATTSLTALNSARTSRLTTQQTALKALSRRLNNLHSQHEYEETRHDAGKHASEILALDAEKFRVAKSAYDVEVEGERLEGELGALRGVLEGLEREGNEGGRKGDEGEGDEVLYVFLVLAVFCEMCHFC